MTFGPSAATLTLLEKLAVDNGFDRELPREGEWIAFASFLAERIEEELRR